MLSPLTAIPDFIVEYWNGFCKNGEEIYTAYIDDIIYISVNIVNNPITKTWSTIFLGRVVYGDLYIYYNDTWVTLAKFEKYFKLKVFW